MDKLIKLIKDYAVVATIFTVALITFIVLLYIRINLL